MTDYTPPGQRLHLEFSTAALSANQPTASIVTHHPHVVAAELLVHKQEKFLLDMNPLLTCFYKGKHYTGTYPLCANGAISALAEYDRNAITAFLNNCSAGAYEASLVSSVMDLATCNDLSHIRSEGYCIGVSEAFINPNQNGIHNVQMSSQFCGIPVSRDSRPFTFNLKTNYHQSTVITLTGSDVYSAFESKCAGTKTTMRRLREMYAATPANVAVNVDVHTTALAGHKVWIQAVGTAFVTLYLMRRDSVKRGKGVHTLLIAAVDVCAEMIESGGYERPVLECAICLDDVALPCWECIECGNKLHTACASKWKQSKTAMCPFCRASMG